MRRARSLGDAMAEAHNQVARRQTPGLNRCGHEWQKVAVVALGSREVVQEAGVERALLDSGTNGPSLVEQREKMGPGPAAAKHFQALFAAAHAGEPIVRQDNSGFVVRVHAIQPAS